MSDAKSLPKVNRSELLWKHFKHKAAAKPTTALRNQISVEYQRIVRKIAHYYAAHCRVAYEDLEQIGMMGILKAVERFDPTKGVNFSSFATPYVRGEILHHLRDSGSNIKVPRRDRELNSKANRLGRAWVVAHPNETLSEAELAAQMGITVEKLQAVRQSVALQHACEYNDDCDEIPTPETYVLNAEQHQGLEQTWARLRQRYNALPDSERTLLTEALCQQATNKTLAKRYNMTSNVLQAKLERVLKRVAQ